MKVQTSCRGSLRFALLVALATLAAGCSPPRIVDLAKATTPTPFTAEQIRDALPPGTRLVHRIEQEGAPPVVNVTVFVSADLDGAVIDSHTQTLDGLPHKPSVRTEASWAELRDHAAFLRSRTKRSEAAIRVPAGRFYCKLYTVAGDQDGIPTTSRFYFARSRPGPPVLYEVESRGRVTFSMKLVEDSRN